MKHLNKIFSVVVTAAIAVSLLVTASPVSAANNYWDQLATPGTTGQVMADNIVLSGLLTPAMNGDLYAYVKTNAATNMYKLAKSTNNGRSWTYVTAPLAADITAITTSPSEANVVYIAQGAAVYKSIDSGATFTSVASVPAGTVSALGVALLGGSYKIFAGTTNGGAGNVYILNEGDFPKAFGLWDVTFGARDILALKLSPAFTTDNGIIVAGTDGTDTKVFISIGGSPFSGTFSSATVATVASAAAIAFPAEFSLTGAAATPVFYVGLSDGAGTLGGVYRFAGSAASTLTNLVGGDVVSLAATGSYAGTGTIVAGTLASGVTYSAASGIGTWSTPSRQPTGVGATFVALGTSASFALRAAGAVDDESGFFMSTDSNKDFNGISLLNSTIAAIDPQLAVASNGDIFMVTTATGTGLKSVWRYFGGNWERTITGKAVAALGMITVSPNYATDKYVFFYDSSAMKFNYSSNNGLTFSAQTTAVPAAATDYEVLDSLTLIVATGSGVYKTANNGVFWGVAPTTSQAITNLIRSSDGTTLVGNVGGALVKSTDLGNTWTTASTDAVQILAGITDLTFQNGSNNVIWATTAGGLFSIDLSATTVAWDTTNRATNGTATLDEPAAAFTGGLAVVSGVAPSGKYAVYAVNASSVARKLSFGTSNVAGSIALPGTLTGAGLFIQPASGANKLWLIASNGTIWTLTDQLAVAVAGVAIGANTTSGTAALGGSSTVINWTALTGATKYFVDYQASSTAKSNPYTSTQVKTTTGTTVTLTGLDANTTYTASVWAMLTNDGTTDINRVSFAGSVTFSTPPPQVGTPANLAPPAGASNVPTVPSFQWAPVDGATSYTVEVSTSSTFATLVGTKITTTVPAAAWTGTPLAYNTTYYWRVIAITATGSGAPVIGVFTTVAAPVTVPPTSSTPVVTPTITNIVTVPPQATPAYIWAIIGIGALLVIVVIVLIVRTRRVA